MKQYLLLALVERKRDHVESCTLTANIHVHLGTDLGEFALHQCHCYRVTQGRGRDTGGYLTDLITLGIDKELTRTCRALCLGFQSNQNTLRRRLRQLGQSGTTHEIDGLLLQSDLN